MCTCISRDYMINTNMVYTYNSCNCMIKVSCTYVYAFPAIVDTVKPVLCDLMSHKTGGR